MPFITSHTIFIATVLINLTMIAFLLIVVKGNRNYAANCFLSLFCLSYAIISAYDILISKVLVDHYPILIEGDTFLLLTLGPFLYLYVLAMTKIRFRFRPKYLLHLLPVVIYLIYLLPFKLLPASSQLSEYHRWQHDRYSAPLMMIYFSKFVVLVYLILAYQLIINHQRVMPELLGNVDGKSLQWAKRLIMLLMVIFVVWICNNEGWLRHDVFFDVVQTVFTYWLGYYVINQKAIYTNVNETASLLKLSEDPKVRYRNSLMPDHLRQDLVNKITDHVTETRPYLNQELTLTMLADQLELPTSKLSQVLNDGFGENFYAFINRYRVEESKRLLSDPEFSHYNILGIAYEAGFNSKSTFNKVFREVTGLKPSDFQKESNALQYKKVQ